MKPKSIYTTPQYAPLYEPPPYAYKGFIKVSAFCRVDRATIKNMIPRQFEVNGDVIEVFVMDVPDAGALGAYREGGIVVPVSYLGRAGGHVLYEIVTSDDSMAVGREVWGYPKKMGEVDWHLDDRSAHCVLSRRGSALVEIDFQAGGAEFERPTLNPRFQTRIIPSCADTSGATQVIENVLGSLSVIKRQTGTAQVALGRSPSDPFSDFNIIENVGAELLVANFILGYGTLLENG